LHGGGWRDDGRQRAHPAPLEGFGGSRLRGQGLPGAVPGRGQPALPPRGDRARDPPGRRPRRRRGPGGVGVGRHDAPSHARGEGTELTSKDYAFGLEVLKSPNDPLPGATATVNIGPQLDRIEVQDDKTFVMVWPKPFYQFDAIGWLALQPIPTQLLRGLSDDKNYEALGNHVYWRGDYFQVGPYRPTKFEPNVEIVLQSVPTYFLGK